MKARVLWDKILRVGIKICMLTGVAFTFAACYAPARIPEREFEATGEITDEEDEKLENIEVRIKAYGHTFYSTYSDSIGQYRIYQLFAEGFPDSVDVIAWDTSGVYETDSTRVKVEYTPSESPVKTSIAGKLSVHQDFQLKKK